MPRHVSRLADFINSDDPSAAAECLAEYRVALPERAAEHATKLEAVEQWISASQGDGRPSPLLFASAHTAALELSATAPDDY